MNMNIYLFIIYCPICIGCLIATSILLARGTAKAILAKKLSGNIIGNSKHEATRYVGKIKVTHRKVNSVAGVDLTNFINEHGLESVISQEIDYAKKQYHEKNDAGQPVK